MVRSTSATASANSTSSLLYSFGAFPIAAIIADIPCGFSVFPAIAGLPEASVDVSLLAFMLASIFFKASGLAPIDLAISIAFSGSMLAPIFLHGFFHACRHFTMRSFFHFCRSRMTIARRLIISLILFGCGQPSSLPSCLWGHCARLLSVSLLPTLAE